VIKIGLEIIDDAELPQEEEKDSGYICPACSQAIMEKDLMRSEDEWPFHKECLKGG